MAVRNGDVISAQAIPEPTPYLLLITGGVMVGIKRKMVRASGNRNFRYSREGQLPMTDFEALAQRSPLRGLGW
ncbi:PEP-CTERM sorting domain-containing protein [Ideonella livida]|uniref:PEP-CTERM sorting domain-containing protein n=1 Tax=Ideonella livida TaxID=2707176 RepID=A0A7C9TMN9_9BURK|nr:PEP-CTERM sorting domain-containing protein [Ideonella livida]